MFANTSMGYKVDVPWTDTFPYVPTSHRINTQLV